MVVPKYVKEDVLLLQLYSLATEQEQDTINWEEVIRKGIKMDYPIDGVGGCYMYKIPWREGGYTVVFIDPLTGTIVHTLNDDQISGDIEW